MKQLENAWFPIAMLVAVGVMAFDSVYRTVECKAEPTSPATVCVKEARTHAERMECLKAAK